MQKLILTIAFSFVLFFTISFGQENQYNTNINISNGNFKMIKPNLTGTSYGCFILGIGSTPNKSRAIENLVENAAIEPGSRRCVANVNVNRRIIFFLIGAIMVDVARGDLIEYQNKLDCDSNNRDNVISINPKHVEDNYINQPSVNHIININTKYDDLKEFSEHLAAAKLNGKWGYINEKGNEVINFKFDKAGNFENGTANVIYEGKSGYIDNIGTFYNK